MFFRGVSGGPNCKLFLEEFVDLLSRVCPFGSAAVLCAQSERFQAPRISKGWKKPQHKLSLRSNALALTPACRKRLLLVIW